MNTENCSEGYFTDEIGVPFHSSPPCQASTYFWLIAMSCLILCRGSLSCYHFKIWFRREAKLALTLGPSSGRTNKQLRRFPIVPTLSFSVFLSQVVLLTLSSTNIVNATNGTIYPVFALYFSPSQIMNQLFALKLLRLGKKLSVWNGNANSTNKKGLVKYDDITKLDFSLKAFIFIFWFAFSLERIADILCVAVPPAPLPQLVRFGYTAALVMNFTVTVQILHQLNRVIRAISPISKHQRVLHSIKVQRVWYFLLSLPMYTMYLYALITYDVTYLMIIFYTFFELVLASTMIISTLLTRLCGGKKNKKMISNELENTDGKLSSRENYNPQTSTMVLAYNTNEPASSTTTANRISYPIRKKATRVSLKNELRTIEAGLMDPERIRRAIELAKQSRCVENLLFWQALRENSFQISQEMVKEFILTGSPHEIVLPENLRKKISKNESNREDVEQVERCLLNDIRFNPIIVEALLGDI